MQPILFVVSVIIFLILVLYIAFDIFKNKNFSRTDSLAVLGIVATILTGIYTYPEKPTVQPPTKTFEESPTFTCEPGDYVIEDVGAIEAQIDTIMCMPSWAFGWISTDAARLEIPDVYNYDSPVGFTIAMFGPVRFKISGVESKKVRLDVRDGSDTSLLGNTDGKSFNQVYKDGIVCEFQDYTDAGCPE